MTYEGVGATKKWERLESYGPKFCENAIQAIARDILMYAMQTLRNCSIVAHVHDELIIEVDRRMSLSAVCEQMGRTPALGERLTSSCRRIRMRFLQKRLKIRGFDSHGFFAYRQKDDLSFCLFHFLRRIRYGRINQNQL